jgi:hypothetical protein
VAGGEEAGKGGVSRPREQSPVEQELLGLVERLERAVRRQPALVRTALAQRRYSPIT